MKHYRIRERIGRHKQILRNLKTSEIGLKLEETELEKEIFIRNNHTRTRIAKRLVEI
jgi:hypothetical protein